MSTHTQTGTAELQGRLWSARAGDWATIQEPLMKPAFDAALDSLGVADGTRMLDVGCGSGLALRLAADRGADVAGLDASEGLLDHARTRVPGAPLAHGELEQLPYEDASFDLVTGFNSFQYAARPAAALGEAKRVAIPSGRVLLMVWAPAERCQAADFLAGLGAMMPPPPPGAPGPFALSGADALEHLFGEVGLEILSIDDVSVDWRYTDERTAIDGLICAGPAIRVIERAGEEAVVEMTRAFLEPFRTDHGGYALTNTFRYVIGTSRH